MLARLSRKTAVFRAAIVLLPFSVLAASVLAAWPTVARSEGGTEAEGDYDRKFLRAARKFLSELPRRQAEGAAALKRLGRRAIPQIKLWLGQARAKTDRMRRLLSELDDEVAPLADPTDQPALRDFLSSKLTEGWQLLLDGEYDRALGIAQGLEALDGDSSRILDYRRLLRASQQRRIRSRVLEPAVEFHERVYEAGNAPAVLFRLQNHQPRQVVIQAKRGELATLEVSVECRSRDGWDRNAKTGETIRTLEGVENVVVPPRQSYKQSVPLRLEKSVPKSGVVARVRVVGKFRPAQWGIGKYNVSDTLEVPATECWIVPEGMRAIGVDPIRKLEYARILEDFDKFFIAGQLAVWGAEGDAEMTDRVVRVLVASLEDLDGTGYRVADGLLKQATGVSEKKVTDRDFWHEWIEKYPAVGNRQRRRTKPLAPPVILDRKKGRG